MTQQKNNKSRHNSRRHFGNNRNQSNRRAPWWQTRPISDDDLKRFFVVCGTCSDFLLRYRISHGSEAIQAALGKMDNGWISLDWSAETRRIIHTTYGLRTDIDEMYLETTCDECCRKLVFEKVGSDLSGRFTGEDDASEETVSIEHEAGESDRRVVHH